MTQQDLRTYLERKVDGIVVAQDGHEATFGAERDRVIGQLVEDEEYQTPRQLLELNDGNIREAALGSMVALAVYSLALKTQCRRA